MAAPRHKRDLHDVVWVWQNVRVANSRVTDLLAEQPDEVLSRMKSTLQGERARLEAELARVAIEEQLIEQAQLRRSRAGQRSATARVTRQQVYEVAESLVRSTGDPVSAAQVSQALKRQDLEASVNAVRNHLVRLVDENGTLVRLEDGRFNLPPHVLAAIDFAPASADDDVSF